MLMWFSRLKVLDQPYSVRRILILYHSGYNTPIEKSPRRYLWRIREENPKNSHGPES